MQRTQRGTQQLFQFFLLKQCLFQHLSRNIFLFDDPHLLLRMMFLFLCKQGFRFFFLFNPYLCSYAGCQVYVFFSVDHTGLSNTENKELNVKIITLSFFIRVSFCLFFFLYACVCESVSFRFLQKKKKTRHMQMQNLS